MFISSCILAFLTALFLNKTPGCVDDVFGGDAEPLRACLAGAEVPKVDTPIWNTRLSRGQQSPYNVALAF
jgi:hypothetical protein